MLYIYLISLLVSTNLFSQTFIDEIKHIIKIIPKSVEFNLNYLQDIKYRDEANYKKMPSYCKSIMFKKVKKHIPILMTISRKLNCTYKIDH